MQIKNEKFSSTIFNKKKIVNIFFSQLHFDYKEISLVMTETQLGLEERNLEGQFS